VCAEARVDWLLAIVMVTAEGNEPAKTIPFATKGECVAAARNYVAEHPQFEFHEPTGDEVIRPVVRSYVECVEKKPETEG
jgi:hypothetical protein